MIGPLVLILVGVALAFAGYRLVWLLVGAAGFVLGYQLVSFLIPTADDLLLLVVGVVVGLVGAWFATRFASLLINIAAFVLIGNLALAVVALFGITGGIWALLAFLVGGLAGLGLVRFALTLALVVISSIGGAAMVMQGLPELLSREPGTITALIGLIVLVGGFLVQYRMMRAQPQS